MKTAESNSGDQIDDKRGAPSRSSTSRLLRLASGAAAIVASVSACTSSPRREASPSVSTGGAPFGSRPGSVAVPTAVAGSVGVTGGVEQSGESTNDLLVEQVVGVPLDRVDQRVLSARSAVAAECLTNRGFEPTRALSDQVFTELPPSFGGYADYMIRRIDAKRVAGVVPGPAPSTEEESAWVECDQSATRSAPDPVAKYAAWLDTVSSDVADRVEADPRTIEAVRQYDECLAESGYDVSGLDPQFGPAVDIYTNYANGQIAYEAAVGQLRALSEAESPQTKAANECNISYDSVTDQVYSEHVDAFLDENAELLTELRQSLEGSLKQLDGVRLQ